ncbi:MULTISPECIES: hypothetical protein [unclassified Streptomyces]|uniref:hypothetical protein n=1 Tax=unclassified Streptomyces TaxID=2593676 RepID=UPI000B85B5B5|nr:MULTISPECIES: hypothetical protein [unclassified Streptomyces]MYZ33703.1 hypothetical protein [Streptomyces sp. SID4917]
MGGLKQGPVHIESNSGYFSTLVPKYLLLAAALYVPLRILDWPGWIAWPAAGLYPLWELARERSGFIELSRDWNTLLAERQEQERLRHGQQLKKKRGPGEG